MNKKLKIGLSKKERIFLVVQAFLVGGIFVFLYLYNSPSSIGISGKIVYDEDFTFEISEGEFILLSFDGSFEDSVALHEGDSIVLSSGTYYWKVKNWIREGDVREFVIIDEKELFIKGNKSGGGDYGG